jgi:hypothetical protein
MAQKSTFICLRYNRDLRNDTDWIVTDGFIDVAANPEVHLNYG